MLSPSIENPQCWVHLILFSYLVGECEGGSQEKLEMWNFNENFPDNYHWQSIRNTYKIYAWLRGGQTRSWDEYANGDLGFCLLKHGGCPWELALLLLTSGAMSVRTEVSFKISYSRMQGVWTDWMTMVHLGRIHFQLPFKRPLSGCWI